MSVINQMLKDLDNRNADETKPAADFVPTEAAKPNSKVKVALLVLGVAGLFIAGYFLYPLLNANQGQAIVSEPVATKQVETKETSVQPNPVDETVKTELITAAAPVIQKADISNPSETSLVDNQQVEQEAELKVPEQTDNSVPVSSMEQSSEIEVSTSSDVSQNNDTVSNEAELAQTDITPVEEETLPKEENPVAAEPVEQQSSMKMTMVEVDPAALAEKEYQLGLKAIRDYERNSAFAHFVKALSVDPKHIQARKQLSALHYGRKDFMTALETLKVGIELVPDANELRVLAASIHFQHKEYAQAYSYLKSVGNGADTEVYAMRALLAQKTDNPEVARKDYQRLVVLEPGKGKWWLGLAVALSDLEENGAAKSAFKKALELRNLSQSSRDFAYRQLQRLEGSNP